jgi:hypothetical protein
VKRSRLVATRRDAALDQLAVVGDDAQLALAFMEIDPYAIHGWPPGELVRH